MPFVIVIRVAFFFMVVFSCFFGFFAQEFACRRDEDVELFAIFEDFGLVNKNSFF